MSKVVTENSPQPCKSHYSEIMEPEVSDNGGVDKIRSYVNIFVQN